MQVTGETLIVMITVVLGVLGALLMLSVMRFMMLRRRYWSAVRDIESDSQGAVV